MSGDNVDLKIAHGQPPLIGALFRWLAAPMRALLAPSPYREAVKSALVQQGIVLFIAAGFLDGGDIFDICLIAFVGFWVGVYLIRRHRPQTSTKLDLIIVQVSYIPLCILAIFLVDCFWRLRGLPGLL